MQKCLDDGAEPHEFCSRCLESLMTSAQPMWEKFVVSELRAEGGMSEGKRAVRRVRPALAPVIHFIVQLHFCPFSLSMAHSSNHCMFNTILIT